MNEAHDDEFNFEIVLEMFRYWLRLSGIIVERITRYRVIFEDLQPDRQLHESNKLHDEEDQPVSDIDRKDTTSRVEIWHA